MNTGAVLPYGRRYYACTATNPELSIARRIVKALGGGSLQTQLAVPRFAMVYGLVSGMRSYSAGGTTKVYVSIFDVVRAGALGSVYPIYISMQTLTIHGLRRSRK